LNQKNLNTHPLYYLKKTHKKILNWAKYEETRFPQIDLDKFDKGPYLVEMTDTTYDKLEKLYEKLERLKTPKYHENGRKKRTTKVDKIKMEITETAYWKEHYKLFPEDKPKKRGRKKKF